jgi:hypothetical protein
VIRLKSLAKIAALSVATTFALTQPAKAVLINTFEFTDLDGDGTGRVPGEKVTGTITFDSLNPGDTATGVAADSVVVNTIPSWLDSTWGDVADMDEGVNIVNLTGSNNNDNLFTITSGVISDSNFWVEFVGSESLALSADGAGDSSYIYDTFNTPQDEYAYDSAGASLTFSDGSASVPFEFSPTLGLLLMGGVFGISRYAKSRKAIKLIDN